MKKLQIIGNIAKDAEKKENKGGKTFLSFSVGINENYKDANGEWVDKTQWVNCQLYGEKVDASRFTKGSKIYCDGKLETAIYESKVIWYLTVNNFEIVSKATPSAAFQQPAANQSNNAPQEEHSGGDGLPF